MSFHFRLLHFAKSNFSVFGLIRLLLNSGLHCHKSGCLGSFSVSLFSDRFHISFCWIEFYYFDLIFYCNFICDYTIIFCFIRENFKIPFHHHPNATIRYISIRFATFSIWPLSPCLWNNLHHNSIWSNMKTNRTKWTQQQQQRQI